MGLDFGKKEPAAVQPWKNMILLIITVYRKQQIQQSRQKQQKQQIQQSRQKQQIQQCRSSARTVEHRQTEQISAVTVDRN